MLYRDEYEKLAAAPGGILGKLTPDMLTNLSDKLLAMGVRIILLKLGHQGLYLRTGNLELLENLGHALPSAPMLWANQEFWSPCFAVDVVGTTGAGDATIAGFLSALLRDLPPKRAVTVAVGVGACNVEAPDALSGLRSWEETLSRIDHGWEKHAFTIDHPDWRWDEVNKLWFVEK
jgi:sugar/nucleoside kinase (ribokinase family)